MYVYIYRERERGQRERGERERGHVQERTQGRNISKVQKKSKSEPKMFALLGLQELGFVSIKL